MNYYLFRIKKEEFQALTDYSKITIDYEPKLINEDDKVFVFVSETLNILGEYKRVNQELLIVKKPKKEIILRDFIGQLSFVKEDSPRAYKVFAKKIRELTKQDYDMIIKSF